MVLVDAFAQNYRWGMLEILDMTMPQIYMLNAASECNRRRLDDRVGRKSEPRATRQVRKEAVWNGKAVDELNSEEYMAYMRDGQS